jgi:membrane-associated phospholipid phosphatase
MKIHSIYAYPGMILFYLFLISGAVILFVTEKGSWVIWLNENGSYFFDRLFTYWTWLGDGLIFLVPIVLFLFRSYLFLFITFLAIIVQTVFVQGLKRFVFPGLVRPKMYFENFGSFRQIEDIQFYSNNAFPSGHTATAFTCALIFSLFLEDKRWSLALVLVAISVGISRIYLMQHFFIDIYFGSIFGVISAIFSAYVIGENKYLRNRFGNRSLMS